MLNIVVGQKTKQKKTTVTKQPTNMWLSSKRGDASKAGMRYYVTPSEPVDKLTVLSKFAG